MNSGMDRSRPGRGAPVRNDLDLRHFENLLTREKERLLTAFTAIKEKTFSQGQKDNLSEEAMYDQHPADIGTETFEREKDLGLKDGIEINLSRVEGAIARIRQGTYGVCLRCGQPIPEGRLEAAPEAELCVRCQKEEEVKPRSRRPVEEQVIKPGFPDEGEGNEEQPSDEPPLSQSGVVSCNLA